MLCYKFFVFVQTLKYISYNFLWKSISLLTQSDQTAIKCYTPHINLGV